MLFSQFPPPPSTSTLEGGAHSRPSRLRRLSNLRNYRSAVSGAVSSSNSSTGNARSSTASNNQQRQQQPRSPPGDLQLTRSLTSDNANTATVTSSGTNTTFVRNNNTTTNTALSPSTSSLSADSSHHSSNGHESDGGNGNPLTQINSAPLPSRSAAEQANFATTNPTTSNAAAEDDSPASAQPETASLSSQVEDTTNTEAAAPATTAATAAPTTSTTTTTPAMTRPRSSTTGDASTAEAVTTPPTAASFLPSLRLSAYYDPRSTRPSLSFQPVSRTLPSGTETIRVGRYSERDTQAAANAANGSNNSQPSSAPVGFKSKVVSRRHCEFWYEGGKWYIKDVKSSSGTFLNHIRLSPPSQESKAFALNDGDIVQLGIDFKGGEEMIFRCVKMRVELNRGWQNKLNTFNVAAHKRLRTMGAGSQSTTSGGSDCSICLNSIGPCQSLFVAPCSHTWHFKCVRSLLTSPQYPIFICPNCRAGADLEADVDDITDDWQDVPEEDHSDAPVEVTKTINPTAAANVIAASNDEAHSHSDLEGEMDTTVLPSGPAMSLGNLPHAISEPLPIRNTGSPAGSKGTNTPQGPNGEGPITPRNNAGPWVFDGRAGQADAAAAEGNASTNGMRSLDAAAAEDIHMSSDASSR